MLAVVLPQVLATLVVAGDGPIRCGLPLPVRGVAKGLRVVGAGADTSFQWAPLQRIADPDTDRLWVEVAVDGAAARGRIAIAAGGSGPALDGDGIAFLAESRIEADPGGERRSTTWSWHRSGERDRHLRVLCVRAADSADAARPGEWSSSRSDALIGRAARVSIAARAWRRAGILPPDLGIGGDLRQRLLDVVPALPRAPGPRGRGDYVRGRDADGHYTTVTNLEYDTTLGLARLALASGSSRLLIEAYESAWHSVDRDVDLRTGLPFRHGRDHRGAPPEPGHVWVRGLLLVGCLFADRALLEAALERARNLARFTGAGPPAVCARDVGWPLAELEACLRFEDLPVVREAADRLGAELLERWDARDEVFRFEEGGDGEAYKERCWQTGGVLLPALRAHLARTGRSGVHEVISRVEARLLSLMQAGKSGLPLRYWVRDREVFGVLRRDGTTAGALMLDGLSTVALRRVLARRQTKRALRGMLDPDDPDLATAFSMLARCGWVMR